MPYYMRFFDTSDDPLGMEAIAAAFKEVDSAYRLDVLTDRPTPVAELYHGTDADAYAQIEINQPGEELFEAQIADALDLLLDADDQTREPVEQVVRGARRIVVVQVLSRGRSTEDTLSRIGPVWDWLFQTRSGLLYAEGEGYYDMDGPVLEEN